MTNAAACRLMSPIMRRITLSVITLLTFAAMFISPVGCGDGGPASISAGPRGDWPRGNAARGEDLFVLHACHGCHATEPGANWGGPTIAGLYGSVVPLQDGSTVLADEAYLRESIQKPYLKITQGFSDDMQPYDTVLNEQQVSDLVAYIKTYAE